MAARRIIPGLSGKLISGAAAFALTAAATSTPIFAEEPPRKSIYDDIPPPPYSSTPSIPQVTTHSTPTARLASQIGTARLALHSRIVTTQSHLDHLFDRFLTAEHRVVDTVASVAPPRTSNEELLPGSIYVAVTTMAGAVISRNRMLPVRALTPVLAGVAAGWYFLPETMERVGELGWRYEKMVPGVAETHMKIKDGVVGGYKTVEEGTRAGRQQLEGLVGKGRRIAEEWVRKQ